MNQGQTYMSSLEEIHKKLSTIKERGFQNPKETIEELNEIFAITRQSVETDEWKAVEAESYHYLSLAQTAMAIYDEAIASAKEALLLFRQLGNEMMMASVLNNLGRIEYYRANYHKALDFYSDSLSLRRKLEDRKGIAAALNNIGLIYYAIENYAAALKYYEESLAIKSELGDEKSASSTLNNIGMIHVLLGDYSKAIECYTKSMSLRNPATELQEITNLQLNIGEVYLLLGNPYKAKALFEESLKMSIEIGDRRSESIALKSLGNTYKEIKEADKALSYYQSALSVFREIGLKNSIATVTGDIAGIYEIKGDYNLAHDYYQQSINLLREIGDKPTMVQMMLMMGNLYLTQKDYENAKRYLNDVLDIGKQLSMKSACYKAYERLAILHEQLGEFEQAYRAYQNFHNLKEEVFNEEQGKKIAVQQAMFENEQARKEAEWHKQRNVELAKVLAETEILKKIAEEANTFKTELLSIAAHDLKNPLQVVIGFAELIKEKSQSRDIINYAEAIDRAANRMYGLVQDLLSGIKLETNALELKRTTTNLTDLLRVVVEQNRSSAEKKSQMLELTIEENMFAEVDVRCMREVFDNLISNAIKYSPMGKPIVVGTSRSEKGVVVFVKDEGQGLTEDDKQKLFKKFQRLSARPTAGESTTGLGLSIVKHLINLHGGRVWAESEGKDKGTTFFVEIPVNYASELSK